MHESIATWFRFCRAPSWSSLPSGRRRRYFILRTQHYTNNNAFNNNNNNIHLWLTSLHWCRWSPCRLLWLCGWSVYVVRLIYLLVLFARVYFRISLHVVHEKKKLYARAHILSTNYLSFSAFPRSDRVCRRRCVCSAVTQFNGTRERLSSVANHRHRARHRLLVHHNSVSIYKAIFHFDARARKKSFMHPIPWLLLLLPTLHHISTSPVHFERSVNTLFHSLSIHSVRARIPH